MSRCRIFFVLLILSSFFYWLFSEQDPRVAIKQIPNEEREILRDFFQELVFRNHFGYVLFGDKPVSISGYFTHTPFGNILFVGDSKLAAGDRQWATWEKYKNRFGMNKYLLFKEPVPSNENAQVITLINKKVFLETVERHLNLFQKVLGKDVTPKKLLGEVSKSGNLFELIKKDEALYGILLGYGKDNAMMFKRKMELEPVLNPLYESEFSLHFPKPSEGFNTIEEELHFLRATLKSYGGYSRLFVIKPPAFALIENTAESLALRKKYTAMRRMLIQKYAQGDVLEVTLRKLCS